MYYCRFSDLLSFQLPKELDSLHEEFLDFQLLCNDEIPESVWKSSVVQDDADSDITRHRMDIIWHYLSSMRGPDHCYRFSRLCQVAKLVLVIPHSNAQEERVFFL